MLTHSKCIRISSKHIHTVYLGSFVWALKALGQGLGLGQGCFASETSEQARHEKRFVIKFELLLTKTFASRNHTRTIVFSIFQYVTVKGYAEMHTVTRLDTTQIGLTRHDSHDRCSQGQKLQGLVVPFSNISRQEAKTDTTVYCLTFSSSGARLQVWRVSSRSSWLLRHSLFRRTREKNKENEREIKWSHKYDNIRTICDIIRYISFIDNLP